MDVVDSRVALNFVETFSLGVGSDIHSAGQQRPPASSPSPQGDFPNPRSRAPLRSSFAWSQALGSAVRDPNGPQRPLIPSRNFSRSSGVICSQRSIIRPRQCMCGPRGPRIPPNRILLRTNRPSACQKADLMQSKQCRHQPIPKAHHHKTQAQLQPAARTTRSSLPSISIFFSFLLSSCFRNSS